uniref:Hypothetical conserved protein n=1 Tax=uncultured Chloroflexota bacterium TaxID=166587 RepID=H5SCX3_9CHLR|nr:hypothetical conserved protein [uncultured Chloroflexota bacterium]
MDEHSRFRQQAAWTRPLRQYFLGKEEMRRAQRVLEVGCGSGAILQEWALPSALHGLDLSYARLREAQCHAPAAHLVQADGLFLPYAANTFDLVFCHYFLLWVADPLDALREMYRVTCPNGSILALAEPDYEGRIEEPPELLLPAEWQAEALRQRGADVTIGRRLPELFDQAGITLLESGCLAPAPRLALEAHQAEAEWQLLRRDLAGHISEEVLRAFDAIEKRARALGTRYFYVPTWFAWGQKRV